MSEVLQKYAILFSKLNREKNRSWGDTLSNGAPYKPLLLLSVIDLIERGEIHDNLVELTPELGEMFNLYCARILPMGVSGEIALPFYHLKSDGFWHLLPRPGFEDVIKYGGPIRSSGKIRDMLLGATFDNELYQLLATKEERDLLRRVLIESYFSFDLQQKLLKLKEINAEAFEYSKELIVSTHTKFTLIKEAIESETPLAKEVRDQAFRRIIVSAYNHQCAICGIRILTAKGYTAVAAAHIIPWSLSHNDDPRNGFTLCRLCHWVFDEGLTTVNNHYKVKTSPQLYLNDNIPLHVASFEGKEILKPTESRFLPDLRAFEWHKNNIFRNA
ncbi:MAG: HNH endonuclease [Chloroflexi bacterium]|uniref:HNH endonuclease n=1 Tax=Candidatus Chlorohelix allophototropha TaxID=3003348 RepID=A0A8T7M4D9_9CHLR|nr:HNH endonuclease [Chloroflexota bacterium]WJW70066.1 HNH endonuclease [Chloroflexota bacterium L227-S17]